MNWLKRITDSLWLRAAAVRAIKTAGQFGVLVILAGSVLPVGGDNSQVISAWLVDWHTLAGAALGGALFSVLTSLAGLPELKEP